jgi:hypothetical protein
MRSAASCVIHWGVSCDSAFAFTRGDYRGFLAAADTGHSVAPHGPAAVQLHAQKAKAWARIGDRAARSRSRSTRAAPCSSSSPSRQP